MKWATLDSNQHDAMTAAKRKFIDLQEEVNTGLPSGIAASVGPRVNPKAESRNGS